MEWVMEEGHSTADKVLDGTRKRLSSVLRSFLARPTPNLVTDQDRNAETFHARLLKYGRLYDLKKKDRVKVGWRRQAAQTSKHTWGRMLELAAYRHDHLQS